MNRRLLWVIVVGIMTSGIMVKAAAPVVTNVVAQQQVITNGVGTNAVVTTNKLVDIHYDLFDDDGDTLKVRIEISDNGGTLYSVPAFSFTGDIGDGVVTGLNKHVVWDAGIDWDGEYSDKMRVKVFAVDAKGFPGLEWGSEIPPGGFLMGQDGGAELSGPSRHVNIPWSYWLSKYEIRNDQYLDFINSALVAGYVYREGVSSVKAHGGKFSGVPEGATLITIGDDTPIRWNVNNFELVAYTNNPPDRANFPVVTSWFGAMAFARYYGYDLPTEAELEKAARGPDHDHEDEHFLYPWSDVIVKADANFSDSDDPYDTTTPVGYYNGSQTPSGGDMINVYGLYDIAGNVAEWSRTRFISTVEDYEQLESLTSADNDISSVANRVHRGGSYESDPEALACYKRVGQSPETIGSTGFRVVRRSIENDEPTGPGAPGDGVDPDAEIGEYFDSLPEWATNTNGNWTVEVVDGLITNTWQGNSDYTYILQNAVGSRSTNGYIQLSQPPYAVAGYITLPTVAATNIISGVDVWARRMNSYESGTLKMQVWTGYAWFDSGSASITYDDYTKIHFDVLGEYTNSVEQVRFSGIHGVYIDDVSIFSVPK